MNNIFVFDIETIPDVEAGKKLHELEELNDHDVAEAMLHKRRQQANGSEFLPHYLHRIVAISVVLRTPNNIKVWSLGEKDSSEKELLERFFKGIEKFTPTLVSWNGGGFDLPVIHYRSLLHGVVAGQYWENGEFDSQFKWNNYLNRYHERHTDLMDMMAAFQARANAPLDAIATMLGFPGKMGMSGAKVWEAFQAGNIEGIRQYCETDVLNTYLVYLKFQHIRGRLPREKYKEECDALRAYLKEEEQTHFGEFLEHWQS